MFRAGGAGESADAASRRGIGGDGGCALVAAAAGEGLTYSRVIESGHRIADCH